jgi:hypothetical protein
MKDELGVHGRLACCSQAIEDATGQKTCIVYGALPAETRRHQVRLPTAHGMFCRTFTRLLAYAGLPRSAATLLQLTLNSAAVDTELGNYTEAIAPP